MDVSEGKVSTQAELNRTWQWIGGIATVIAIALGIQNFFLNWQAQTNRSTQEIVRVQYTLLQDQVQDYQSQLASARTYDEGYMAAMLRSKENREYVEGYHKAMAQVAVNDVTNPNKYVQLKAKLAAGEKIDTKTAEGK